jgi:hypothetical protein
VVPPGVELDAARGHLPEAVAEWLQQREGIQEERARLDPAVVVLELHDAKGLALQERSGSPHHGELVTFHVDLDEIDMLDSPIRAERVEGHGLHGFDWHFRASDPPVQRAEPLARRRDMQIRRPDRVGHGGRDDRHVRLPLVGWD